MSDAGHLLSGVHPKKMFFLFHFCDFLIKIGTYVNCNFFSILRHITDQRSAHAHFQNNSFHLINPSSTPHQPRFSSPSSAPQTSKSSNRKFFSSQINQFQPFFTPHPSPSHFSTQKLATASKSTIQPKINQFFSTFDTTAAVFYFFTLKNRILYCNLWAERLFSSRKSQFPRRFYWCFLPHLSKTMAKSSKIMPQNTLFKTFLLLALLPALSIFSTLL